MMSRPAPQFCGTVPPTAAHAIVRCSLHPMKISGSRNRPLDVSPADAQMTCQSCGLRVDTPHANDADCIAALRAELDRYRESAQPARRNIA